MSIVIYQATHVGRNMRPVLLLLNIFNTDNAFKSAGGNYATGILDHHGY